MILVQPGVLFGQVNRQPQGDGADAGMVVGMVICYGVLILLGIIIQIFFLLTLSRCLGQVAPRNRTMEPGMVWLNLIPLFSLVWMFITIIRISESLQKEYRSRGMHADDPEFGKMTGILYMVFSLIGCGPVGLVFFIMYWVKISGYKKELMSRGGSSMDFDDDDDDRPRRRDRRDDDD